LRQRSSKYEAPDGPEHEAQRHVVLSTDPIHQEPTQETPGEIKAIDHSL
jgi:hypothetical protein